MDNQTVTVLPDVMEGFWTKLDLFPSYEGFVSCFQLYNRSLSYMEIEATEFCPDRIGKSCFFAYQQSYKLVKISVITKL